MKNEKKYTLNQVCLIIIIASILITLFGAKGFYNWAKKIKNEHTRKYIISITEPIYNFSSSLKLDLPMDNIRNVFLSISKNIGKIDLLSFNATNNKIEINEISQKPEKIINKKQNKDKKTIKILLIGDSMAAPLAYAFLNVLKEKKDLKHIKLLPVWRISSTLSAPVYGDWSSEIKKFIKEKYDLTIIVLGSNDAQSIHTPKIIFKYGTKEWKDEHKRRAKDFIETITKTGSKVYWIDVPPMRLAGYKEMMIEINKLYSDICKEIKNTYFIETTNIIGDNDGLYSLNLKINEKFVRVRESDGIHVTIDGAKLIIYKILEKIKLDFEGK